MAVPRHAAPKKTHPLARTVFLMILAMVLLLSAVAAVAFRRTMNRSAADIFSVQSAVPTIPPAPGATDSPYADIYDEVASDWVDSDGAAWNYRDDVINMLFIGVDYMSEESHWDEEMPYSAGNSDVLILASLDTLQNTLSVLSIPRDTMADLVILDRDGSYLGTSFENISLAHSYGDSETMSCQLAADAVSRLLCGIPIHRYGSLDYAAIKTVNQLLGGLEVTFDKDYTHIDPSFTAGTTMTLTDDQFLAFIEDRDITVLDSAVDRSSRHVFLMNALYDTCKDAFLEDLTFPVRMYNGIKDHIVTNLNVTEITYLAGQVFEADFDAAGLTTLPGELIQGEIYAEYYADTDWIEDYVAEKLSIPAK